MQLPFQYIPPAVAPKHIAGNYVLDDTILSVSLLMMVITGWILRGKLVISIWMSTDSFYLMRPL